MQILHRSKAYNFIRVGTGSRSHCWLVESDGRQFYVVADHCEVIRA
jgi:hypothetical protein